MSVDSAQASDDERVVLARDRRLPDQVGQAPEPPAATAPPPVPAAPPPALALPPIAPIGSVPHSFSYGYCTWWVAAKRPIPWEGNAIDWWPNARSFGFAEGPQPRAGAIMVVGPAGGASWQGHVAYVEFVNPDGSFVVSEMNWGQWGVVGMRTITSRQGILGFIY